MDRNGFVMKSSEQTSINIQLYTSTYWAMFCILMAVLFTFFSNKPIFVCLAWFCFDLALGISKLSAIIGQGDKALLILGKVCTYKVQTFAKEQKSERNFLEIHS